MDFYFLVLFLLTVQIKNSKLYKMEKSPHLE